MDPGRPWFPALDGLRGLAAVLVVVFHVTGAVAPFAEWTWGPGLARLGNLGVALFFVLSGFLLSRPFFAAHLAEERPPALGRYAVRRLARIVPAYWVALTVWLFVIRDAPPEGGNGAYALFYGFAQVYDRRYVEGGGSLSVAWTLSIEMSFYIVLPALAWVLCRLASRGSIRRRVMVLAGACTALFVGGALLRWWMWEQQGTDWPLRTYTLLGHIGWFGIGMALAALAAGAAAGVRPPRWVRDLAGLPVLAFGLAAAVAWLTTLPELPGRFPHPPDEQLLIFVCNGLAGALCLLPLVIGDQTVGTTRRLLTSPPARWLGQISYGLYLWHTPILTEVNQWVAEDRVPGSAPARFAIVAILSLAVAHLSWVVVERPVLALANRVARR